VRAEPPVRNRSVATSAVLVAALVVALLPAACGTAPATSGAWTDPSPSSTPAGEPSLRAVAGKVIVVDPGHNGGNAAHPTVITQPVDAYTHHKPCNTVGASTPDGYPEHAFTWDVGSRLAELLTAAGAQVVTTRSSDSGVGPCVTERAEIANRSGAAAAISIHADGAPAEGRGFHVLAPAAIPGAPSAAIVEDSHRLAVAVRDHLRAVAPPATYIGRDGINTRSDMAGLNLSRVPVVMVECGNMRNPTDAANLASPAYRQRLAEALAAGVATFLAAG